MSGPRPFVTRVHYRAADGHLVDWSARRHRKSDESSRGLTWWIGLPFAIGSTRFLIGPIPAFEDAVGMPATDATFFIGSIFFTTASYLSYLHWAGWSRQQSGWQDLVGVVGRLLDRDGLAGLLPRH